MDLHVIRRKSDGLMLPRVNSHHSYAEVSSELPPRLFKNAGSAKTTLHMWCSGYWHTERSGSYEDYEQSTPMPLGKGQRNIDEYEVVPVTLMLG